ncbi:hypothetical protein SCNU_02170 [Gordonia neofelifaecis NRRL B-59395]|uniref:Uncharacterized protein n=1 Tax=Gordonia neofelifaecis NRRL B-59395 TaxID=644548 RepID=F1YE52_9ACTN|nr:hypothetical protein SCNU_02170 [Gordonia neofelifaecis NRRL B-59395]
MPDWASDVLRRAWPTLSADDQRALVDDHDNAVLRDLAVQMRRTDSADSLSATPAGDFTLDGWYHAGLRWHAERFEEPWNGWATPVVTVQTLRNLIGDLAADGAPVGRIQDNGVFTVFAEDLDDNYDVHPDADGLYHLYELGWTFLRCGD